MTAGISVRKIERIDEIVDRISLPTFWFGCGTLAGIGLGILAVLTMS